VPCIIHPQHRLPKDRLEPFLDFGVVPVAVAGHIAVALVGGSLDQAQLPYIPGNGGLGHLIALGVQVFLQLFLPADGMLADQPEDGLQPFGPGPGVFLRFAAHGNSASFITITLFDGSCPARQVRLRSFWSMAWNWSARLKVISWTFWSDRRTTAVAPARSV